MLIHFVLLEFWPFGSFRFPEPPLILLYQYCVLLPLALSPSLLRCILSIFECLTRCVSLFHSVEIECIHTRAISYIT